MRSGDPKMDEVLANFETLSTIATSLNTASDELAKVVGTVDETLKKLNLGLTVWVPFRFRGDDDYPQEYDQDQIGYAKVNGTWGISLRRIWGDESRDIYHEDGPWPFNAASRELRLLAVDMIPGLIEALAKNATNTTKRVQDKTKQVRELANAIEKRATESQPLKNLSALAGILGKEGVK